MDSLWSYIRELGVLEIFLLACIIGFLFAILLFIILILSSRVKKIRRENLRKKYTAHINKILFSIAFDGATIADVKKDSKFIRNWKRRFYKQQFLTELIKLHRLYGGEIAVNIRRCYTDFRLIQLSYAKIRSRRWEIKCAGIQELSEMEIKKAVPVIQELTKSRNDTLKMVALTEVLHLSGLEGISLLQNYQEPLNDWIQLNLLESIKETHSDKVPDFGYLLDSNNESIVVFGLRLLKIFDQNQHLSAVKELQNSPSRKINLQAKRTYNRLTETSDGIVHEEGFQPQYIPNSIIQPEEKESYNRKVVIIILLSILLIYALVAFYLLYIF